MSNYRRYYISNAPIFVTVVTKNRSPWLIDCVNQLLASMREAKNKYPYRHIAHVVMDDHFHWLFEMSNENNFSKLVTFVKRDVIWRLKEGEIHEQWQNRFYDHVIRDQKDLDRHIDYVHFNPVKHGAVLKTSEYSYSSFNEWRERGRYDENWGETEPDDIRLMSLE